MATETTTEITTEALVAWLSEQSWSSFAQSLADWHGKKGYLSEKQEAAARKMHAKCMAKAAAKGGATKAKEQAAEGLYVKTGQVYKVVTNKAGTNRYAKVWSGSKWVYAAGAVYGLTADDAMSAEQAAEFGQTTGACVACGRTLTDDRSVSVGYGPVCASTYGWPWG